MKFKVGDKVKINKQATIEDFTKDSWNGCQENTLNFLRSYGGEDKIFKVIYVDNDYLDIKDIENNHLLELVNINIFEKVKEMTITEIEKELGYPIKVIKENNIED